MCMYYILLIISNIKLCKCWVWMKYSWVFFYKMDITLFLYMLHINIIICLNERARRADHFDTYIIYAQNVYIRMSIIRKIKRFFMRLRFTKFCVKCTYIMYAQNAYIWMSIIRKMNCFIYAFSVYKILLKMYVHYLRTFYVHYVRSKCIHSNVHYS